MSYKRWQFRTKLNFFIMPNYHTHPLELCRTPPTFLVHLRGWSKPLCSRFVMAPMQFSYSPRIFNKVVSILYFFLLWRYFSNLANIFIWGLLQFPLNKRKKQKECCQKYHLGHSIYMHGFDFTWMFRSIRPYTRPCFKGMSSHGTQGTYASDE